ncbi:MAG: hypothetical protein L3K10_08565 [Thermoplasmata archaeon]|nr:hypothetical protein [Thermoplasmata archaeon]
MDYRGPGRRTLALVLALIVVLSLLGIGTSTAASHGATVKRAAGSSVNITASTGFAFSPSLISNAATNSSFLVTFRDGDTQTHTFTISSREGYVIPTSDTPSQLESFFNQYHPLFSVTANFSQTVIQNFTSPAKGWYEFVCNESGHFQNGMYGFIAFGESPPSNLSVSAAYDGPGSAVFIIVGTIVVLTVIAIVLGFVVGRRRGALHEMAPERLGYPEPRLPAEPAPPPRPPKG